MTAIGVERSPYSKRDGSRRKRSLAGWCGHLRWRDCCSCRNARLSLRRWAHDGLVARVPDGRRTGDECRWLGGQQRFFCLGCPCGRQGGSLLCCLDPAGQDQCSGFSTVRGGFAQSLQAHDLPIARAPRHGHRHLSSYWEGECAARAAQRLGLADGERGANVAASGGWAWTFLGRILHGLLEGARKLRNGGETLFRLFRQSTYDHGIQGRRNPGIERAGWLWLGQE